MFQCIPWLLDIIENFFLFSQIIKKVKPMQPGLYKAYMVMEAIKWGGSVIPAVCAMSIVIYFWLSGNYSGNVKMPALCGIGELIVFASGTYLLQKGSGKKDA